jgi:hypothetical protein
MATKHIFPLLLDGATQTISSAGARTWDTNTSIVNVTASTNTTVTIPAVKADGRPHELGTLVVITCGTLDSNQTVKLYNLSVDANNLIATLDGTNESTTLMLTNSGWFQLAREHSSGTVNADNLTLTGTLTVAGAATMNGNVVVGNATTDTIGFYGATATAQIASADQAAVTNPTFNATFSNTELQNAFVATNKLLNKLRADLVTLGLIKGAA